MNPAKSQSTIIHDIEGSRNFLLHIAGRIIRKWQDSLSYRYSLDFDPVLPSSDSGALILLWHNRLFLGLGGLQHSVLGRRPLHALVSASRDGAQLSHFIQRIGIEPIRGSSSRRGATATRELLRALGRGHNVAITVDGPRGPCYEAQAGAALLVQMTGVPVYFVGAESEQCHTLRSWDRFILPQPFSRVSISLKRYTHPPCTGGREERAAIQALIQSKLTEMTRDCHLMDNQREPSWN